VRERDAGGAAAGADVDDRPLRVPQERDAAKRVLEQDEPGLVERERRQPGRRDDRAQPVVKRA